MTSTGGKSDSKLRDAVLRELAWDSRVKASEVGVEVRHGIVTLTGTVHSYGKKQAAAEAAHRVRGVLDLANDITVSFSPVPQRTDTEIAEALERVGDADRIEVAVDDGSVELGGRVRSWADKRAVLGAVSHAHGVCAVVDKLRIDPEI